MIGKTNLSTFAFILFLFVVYPFVYIGYNSIEADESDKIENITDEDDDEEEDDDDDEKENLLNPKKNNKYYFQNGEIFTAIQKNKRIRVGVSRYYPPLHNTVRKNGKLEHIGVEIKMAKSLGAFFEAKVEIIPLDMQDYVSALKNRKVDIVIAGLSRNLTRGRKIWYSDPYYKITPGVLVDARILPQTKFGDEFEEDPFRTIWDLKRLPDFTYAVKKGSSYAELIKEKFPGQKIRYVQNNSEGLELLLKNKVHGFVHDSIFLKYQYEKTPQWKNRYLLLRGGPLTEELSIGLPMGDTILKTQVDFWISEILRQNKIEDWMKQED